MAKCPCACGRSVPIGRGAAARSYNQVADLSRTIHSITPESAKFVPSTFFDSAPQFTRRAELVTGWLLDHLHKTVDSAATPNMKTIDAEMRALAQDVATSLRGAGPPEA